MWHRPVSAPPTIHVQVSSDSPLKTAAYTLIGGILLFLLSEAIRGLVLKPAVKMRELRGTIIDRVIFYQNRVMGSVMDINTQQEVSTELRSLATQFRAAETGIA